MVSQAQATPRQTPPGRRTDLTAPLLTSTRSEPSDVPWESNGMSTRPRATLARVLDDLGGTFTDQVLAEDLDREVSTVVIHDVLDDARPREDAVLLGVGVTGTDAVRELLQVGREAAACAVVVRSPVEITPDLEAAVRGSGVALLTLRRGASWTQLATLLGSLLSQGDFGPVDSETLGGLPSGDLFAVANAIGSLLGAPITIEDRNTRVLAFSGNQDEADPSRIETVLGRQVPERFASFLAERGVFDQLYRSSEPVYVEPLLFDDAFTRPRVAMAVRAGDEVLGSIWAVVPGPLDETRTRAMVDASSVVALHLLRLRAGADVERRLRADLVSTALEGGPNAADALERLGLHTNAVCVVAVRLVEPSDQGVESIRGVEHRAGSTRLADSLAVHLVSSSPRSAAALVGEVVYGLVPSESSDRVEAVVRDFATRLADRQLTVIGVSDPARGVEALPRARSQADRASRALLRRTPTAPVAAQIGKVSVDTVLMDLADLTASRDDVHRGAVATLVRHDEENGSQLVDTLAAWLDAFGDVTTAARLVHVHPNTFRYRLRRLAEIADLDLGDPDARFAAMLELRMRETRS